MTLEETIVETVRKAIREGFEALRRPDLPEMLSVKDAARAVSVSKDTINAWLKDGLLERYGHGRSIRVKRDELLSIKPRSPVADKTPEEIADNILRGKKR